MSTPIQTIVAVAGRFRIRSGYLHMLDLLTGLASRGVDVTLVCVGSPSGPLLSHLPFPIVTWHSLAGRWPGWIGRKALMDFCRRQAPDILHVHDVDLHSVGHKFLRCSPAPVVFTPYATGPRTREIGRLRRRAARVIALSEYMREGLVNRCRFPRENIRVVAPGIDISQYELLPPQANGRVPVVGTVAPLEPGRGQDVFLRAAKRIFESGRAAQFIVAGDGPSERDLRKQAAQLGIENRVVFVTRLPNYRSVIAALDIFVRPGSIGGLGYTVLEAMAMGKAVVAASAGDIPELVARGGSGLMVPKRDPAPLAEAVCSLLDHPDTAREMGLAARRDVSERFAMDRLIENTLRVYGEAIAAHARKESDE